MEINYQVVIFHSKKFFNVKSLNENKLKSYKILYGLFKLGLLLLKNSIVFFLFIIFF